MAASRNLMRLWMTDGQGHFLAIAKPFGVSSYFLAIALKERKVGTKPMQTAAARQNFRMSSGGIFPACGRRKSRRNARFSSISATSASTYTETSCIKDSVGIEIPTPILIQFDDSLCAEFKWGQIGDSRLFFYKKCLPRFLR